MGLVGPDQPWTAENAGKVIAQPTRECPAGREKKGTNEWTRPKAVINGNIVDDPDCFQTGKVIEAEKAGKARWVEWCCPVRTKLPKRAISQSEYEEYKDRCQPKIHPNGTVYETFPEWKGPQVYVSGSCGRPGIFDEGYELVCCPAPPDFSKGVTLPEQTFVQGRPSAEQEAEWEARLEERQLEQEQAAAAAAPPPSTFIERYGFAMLLVGGAVGLGVTASLFKRFSVAAKKAEESKAAIAALQAQQGES